MSDEDLSANPLRSIINNLCTKLHVMAAGMEKLHTAKEKLDTMQRRLTLMGLLGPQSGFSSEFSINTNTGLVDNRQSSIHDTTSDDVIAIPSEEDDDAYASSKETAVDRCDFEFEVDRWRHYFRGFDILQTPEGVQPNENRKCIELCKGPAEIDFKAYLISGVRCFLIDLFRGSSFDNQSILVRLREAEYSLSEEYKFPVVSSVLAKISPRHQYTGYLDTNLTDGHSVELEKGRRLRLTVDREFSERCSEYSIFVNARFLLSSCEKFDVILIGEDIQLIVEDVDMFVLICCVKRPGILYNRMPVLFPRRCQRFQMSYEELEDLTFANEVGINIIIADIVGTVEYLKDFEENMASMRCQDLRLYARVVLNEIQGCDRELDWAISHYDGIYVDFVKPDVVPDVLRLCPDAECFLQLAYEAKKPIILNPQLINDQQLRIGPDHFYHIFFYPDKYLVTCSQYPAFYFGFLQGAMFDKLQQVALDKVLYCDVSHTGVDTLARSVVQAALECRAIVIIVCGVTTRMVQKISHFRPNVPIIFVSHMQSAQDYVSAYYNVTMLSFRTTRLTTHESNVFHKIIFALAYVADQKLVKTGDNIILVYNHDVGTTYPENYIIYKFDKINFVNHMAITLFPQSSMSEDSIRNMKVN